MGNRAEKGMARLYEPIAMVLVKADRRFAGIEFHLGESLGPGGGFQRFEQGAPNTLSAIARLNRHIAQLSPTLP